MESRFGSDPATWPAATVEDARALQDLVAVTRQRAADTAARLEAVRRHCANDQKAHDIATADAILSGSKPPTKSAQLKDSEKELETVTAQHAAVTARAVEIEAHAANYLHRALSAELLRLRKAQLEAAKAAFSKLEAVARELAAAFSIDEVKALFSPAGVDRVSFGNLPADYGLSPRINNLEYSLSGEGAGRFERLAQAAALAAETKDRLESHPATVTAPLAAAGKE